MFWRLPRAKWQQQLGEKNRKGLTKIVDSGEIPGILAYAQGKPVGWCSVAPRERFVRLENSRVLKRVDDQPVWSVVCFFVDRKYRRQGTTVELLRAAIEFARKKKAKIIEGYPTEPRKGQMPDAFAYTGLASAFRQAGFKEVLRRSETRPIMRYFVGKD